MASKRLISRPDDPYRGFKRVFRIALIVSLLIHPLVIALFLQYVHLLSPNKIAHEKRDQSEIVTIASAEKRAPRPIPQSHVEPRAVPKQQPVRVLPALAVPKPVVLPTYPPVTHKHDLAKHAPHARLPELPTAKTVATLAKPSAVQGEAKSGVRRYSAQQLAQINNDFAKTTEAMRGANDPLKNTQQDVATAQAPKHYSMDFEAVNGRSGQGLCDPVKEFDENGYDYYYMVCNLVEPDGSAARLPLPWPIRYKPRADPYKVDLGPREGPIPLPPPEWHPDLSKPMDPVYLGYLREKGYPI